jgi:type 1 glutamine amidotransferase
MRNHLFIMLVLGVFVSATVFSAEPNAPTSDEMNKIKAAMPDKPRVVPAKPRKLLVFSKSYGYFHTAIPYGQAAFRIMGEKTGAFEATVSDDISLFEPNNLAQFDAVVLNNVNQEVFLPEDYQKLPAEDAKKAAARAGELEKALADFVASGKGLVAVHAATNAFRDWPEFANIVGARFDNHPWEAGSNVTLKIEEPNHPLTAAFTKQNFNLTEETYQHKDPYSREDVRVLLSIDPKRTCVMLDHVSWIHRKDNDFAVTWIKSYGKGRVFYCAIGHQHEHFWNPVILQHYLDGIQFALGDLEADTTPSAKLKVGK